MYFQISTKHISTTFNKDLSKSDPITEKLRYLKSRYVNKSR